MPNPVYKLLTWIFLLLGLASSIALSNWVISDIETRAYQEFIYDCEEIQLKIAGRLKAHEQTLLGGAALFDASKSVERDEWHTYVERLRLNEHFNGIQGLGFSSWIPAAQLSAHLASIRAEGFPDYKIRPEGEREAYTSIIFIEPFTDRNLRAFGYDMYSEPVRRVAMERARDENIVALSGRVRLIQETDKNVQAGTLMYVPVYKKGQPIATVEQRRAALFGWVLSPFRMTDLFNNIVLFSQDSDLTQVHLRVYDGQNTQAEQLLYDNNPAGHPATDNIHQRLFVQLSNDFNGTVWTLQFEQIMGVKGLDYSKAWISLGTGVFISLLLFLLSYSYINTRVNAARIAAELTRELQESEKRFRMLTDSAPVLIWLVDMDMLCYHVNKVWLDFTGRTLEQELGNGWAECLHPDDLQRCLDFFTSSFDARLPFTTEYRLRRYDGEYRWLLDNGVPNFSNDGSFLGYIGSCIDITERKQTEHALQRESEKNAALLRNASDGIHILDTDGNIIEVSDSFCIMLGYSREEMIGMNVSQWDALLSPEECLQKIRQQVTKQVRFQFETSHRCKDGSIFDVEVSCFSLKLDDKPVLFFSSRDITERKRVENALQESQVLLQTAQRAARLGHYVIDLRDWSQITWTNDALFNEIFGADENLTQDFANLAQIIHPGDFGQMQDAFRQIYDGEKLLSMEPIEFRIIRPNDKEERWIDAWGSNFYDDKNNPVWQAGMVQDITERKHLELALKASETKFRTMIEIIPVPMVLNDGDDNFIFINPAFTQTFGYELDEVPTLAVWQSKVYPDTDYRQWVSDTWKMRLEEVEHEHSPFKAVELNIRCKDGTEKTILGRAATFQSSFKALHLVILYDITERKQAETKLRIAATVFESQEGMFITDVHKVILIANQAFTRITGYSSEEVIGQTPKLLYSGRHDKEFYATMWQNLLDTGVWQGEIWNRRKNGDVYPEWLTVTAVKGDDAIVTHYVATMTDISERKATEEYINRLAFYDVLTQLPNRRLLLERIKHGIVRFQRTGTEMAVLMMDLDKFKAVNDTLGHTAGDELLQQVAKRIKASLREVDMVARLGGDEFVVLIEDIKQHENLALIAESIIHTLSQVFTLGADHEVYIGVSIGIAICPEHGNSEDALMDNADIALYHAKAQGRGCYVNFSDALTKKIQEHAIMETRLRHAIEQHELYVFFQPQIDIASNQVVGAEAIVLWYHPTHGYFMPKDFLDLAEKTGLIIGIGEWLLRETCKLGRQWLDEGLPVVTLAVKVSPYQFRHINVCKLVTQILEETGFPAQYLALEITETGLMENHEHAQPILNSLHEQGVHLVIDDFGKGYSSLTYLKHFPLDMLKIDKSFIDDLPFSQDDSAITASLIAMAHHLGFKVLAEGVESFPQLTFLRQQGCDKYQGVHSQALPVSKFARLLLNLRDA